VKSVRLGQRRGEPSDNVHDATRPLPWLVAFRVLLSSDSNARVDSAFWGVSDVIYNDQREVR